MPDRQQEAVIGEWMKEIAPSPELRQWFGHIQEPFGEFSDRYIGELEEEPERERLAAKINEQALEQQVKLEYAACYRTI
ncbi:DUF488 family protein, N3 subclade [Paenibacillus tianjinensis]|uniref:DUF488 family protein n=1 Tax=Paenibacillus tianjinensis TaxID=2810347 RepID=A0ABX7L6I7_9BACL|nr:DUF488 family protein [Paenibacillus tianjinensis]QSF43785.1 DUF488 family protein [Paenibacillus tianjinensis]